MTNTRLFRVTLATTLLAFSSSIASAQSSFTITSTEIKSGATIANHQVFNGMGCKGDNVSPQLSWRGAPSDTKSFGVTVYDPDAPTGSGWWHWMVYNLPANTTSLSSGAGDRNKKMLPSGGIQGPTDFGAPGWGGPCPPVGDKPHRYIFTVYALNVEHLDIPVGASSAMVGFNLNGHMLAKTSFTAMYDR